MSTTSVESCNYVQYYMKIGFPKMIDTTDGWDDICRFCGLWCTQNSSCGIRYYKIYGEWADDKMPTCDKHSKPDEGEHLSSIAICDKCMNRYLDDVPSHSIKALNHEFKIDHLIRMND